MTIRDLLKMDIGDVDVVDDYDESCYIAFCSPQGLTSEGEAHFAPILDIPVTYNPGNFVPVSIEVSTYADAHGMDEDGIEKLMESVRELFFGMAGYIPESKYDAWFCDAPVPEPEIRLERTPLTNEDVRNSLFKLIRPGFTGFPVNVEHPFDWDDLGICTESDNQIYVETVDGQGFTITVNQTHCQNI